jgi:Bacterial PH domain
LALGVAAVFMAWLQASAAYTVTDRGVLVQSGPLRRWVDARLVERVRPTRTILSAPALSGNRLEISGRFGVVVVSPHDQAGFVRALRQTAPQMRLEGGLESLIAG